MSLQLALTFILCTMQSSPDSSPTHLLQPRYCPTSVCILNHRPTANSHQLCALGKVPFQNSLLEVDQGTTEELEYKISTIVFSVLIAISLTLVISFNLLHLIFYLFKALQIRKVQEQCIF